MKFSLPCVIFAGGKSSRMGEDKALLPFGGYETLTEYQYRRLLPHFQKLYISTKCDKFPFEAPLIFDDETLGTYAPTAGLLAVFHHLDDEAFFALSVDTPFVDEAVIEKMVSSFKAGEMDAVIAKSPNGIHPMCGIYTRKLLPKLMQMVQEGQHRLGYLLKSSTTHFVPFDRDDPFLNLNHPEEYQLAIKKIQA